MIVGLLIIGLLQGLLYALIALGVALGYGVMKIVNFAQGSFLMVSMYIVYWIWAIFGLDPFLSCAITIPIFFLVGWIMQRTLFKRLLFESWLAQLVATAALGTILDNSALILMKTEFQTITTSYTRVNFDVFGTTLGLPRVMAAIASVITISLVYLFLTRTKMGLVVRATSDDKEVAALMGINVHRTYEFSFGLAMATVAVAASSLMQFFYVTPYVGLIFSLQMWYIIVLAGLGNVFSVIFAGIIFGVAEILGGTLIAPLFKDIVVLLVLMATLWFRPEGLLGRRGR